MTKYVRSGTYRDDRTTLQAFDDAAYIRWGETWRMPTKEEWQELIDNCSFRYETINNVACVRVTGPNGNSIVLPRAGNIWKGATTTDETLYWTSSLYSDGDYGAYCLANNRINAIERCAGLPVRAVYRREWPSFTLTICDTINGTPYTKTLNAASTYTLTAKENSCHRFVRWSDGNTANPRTVTVEANKTYTAEYEEIVYSGTCGDNVNWELKACDSTLTISGDGELAEYAAGEEPWHAYADLIDTIYVPCGKKAYYQSALPDYAERIGYDWCDQYVIDFVNWDGELLQSSLVDRETLPSYNGAMPEKETDELYKYVFCGWTPKVEFATDDAVYTATYLARDKFEAIEDVESGESRVKSQKIIREGVLYIRRGEKIYTVLGTETE